MKKIKKVLLAMSLIGVLSCSSAFLISCRKDSDEVDVSFVTNGGTELEDVSVEEGEEFVLPTELVREGYRFDGWFANSDFSGNAITSITLTDDATFYAKWTQVYAVNLDLNGGSLDTTKIFLAQGENVYDAVKNLQPTKSGLTFGAWFNGDYELSTNATMKSSELNLTAQYKVAYTQVIRLQNLEGNGYDETTITGSDYVGKSFTSTHKATGYTETTEDKNALTKVLSENASDNVFVHTFDRRSYTVTFEPNTPSGETAETVFVNAKFGQEIDVPTDPTQYQVKGYCLLGWTTSPNSTAVEYPVDFSSLLYNPGDDADITKKYTVTDRNNLYGVWQQAYTDMFGGDDYIYLFAGEEEDTVYLYRADVYFKGVYYADVNTFYFDDEQGNQIISGKLYDNQKYVYESIDRAKTHTLFDTDKGIVATEKITFDTYNTIHYRLYEESTDPENEVGPIKNISEGIYEVADNGDYVATFTSGNLTGQTINFILSTITDDKTGVEKPVFQVRNEDEYQIGQIILAGIRRDKPSSDDAVYVIGGLSSMYFELDGFGTAKFTSDGKSTTYKYSTDEKNSKIIYLKNVKDELIETIYLMDIPGFDEQGYMVYEEKMNDTFELGVGDSLTLDGLCYAEYKKGDRTIKSYYRQGTSPMGGKIISIIDPEAYKEYKFLLTPTEDGEKAYTAEVILSTYAEYYYKDAEGVYYAPMLVLDEEAAGRATLYGYTSNKTFEKVSEGTYKKIEKDEENENYKPYQGLYVFEIDGEPFNADVYLDPIDLLNLKWFVFALDTADAGYEVNYWYASNLDEYFTDYRSATTDDATLKTVGGYAFYQAKQDEPSVIGTYTKSGTLLKLDADGKTYYFTLDEGDPDDLKFYALQYAPYKAYLRDKDGKYSTTEYLSYDGLGNVDYVKDGTPIGGTFEQVKVDNNNKLTHFDENIYKFIADGKTFEYVEGKDGSKSYYATWNGTPEVGENDAPTYEYQTTDGLLIIDGYVKARFDGREGFYYEAESGKVIVLNAGGRTYYFDKVDGEEVAFTVRGAEYGEYALFENQYFNGEFVKFDGYGKLSWFTADDPEGVDGTYEINGEEYTLTFGLEETVYVCVLGGTEYTESDKTYSTLSVSQKIEKSVLVSTKDWSVLILDEFGRAVKADKNGKKQEGKYTFVTDYEKVGEDKDENGVSNEDGLLYFVGNDGSGCIYNYNLEREEASPVELTEESYYTEDLKSLYFSPDGFVIVNGEEDELRFYTYKEVADEDDDPDNDRDNDEIIIYTRSESGKFIPYNFGTLDNIKTYPSDGGETYYKNGKDDIKFTRSDEETLYPLVGTDYEYRLTDIRFRPTGGAEFKVTGTATMIMVTPDDKEDDGFKEETEQLTCTVTREIVDGTPKLYVNFGYYRYYITATYSDTVKTYQVDSLQQKQTINSYFYLGEYVYTYRTEGLSAAEDLENKHGTIDVEINYATDGSILNSTASASFGDRTEFYDGDDRITEAKGNFIVGKNGKLDVIEFEANDQKYQLHFAVYTYPGTLTYGYYVHSIARLQELTYGDYTLTVGRTVATEQLEEDEPIGNVFTLSLKKGNEAVECDQFFEEDGKFIYVVRERSKAVGVDEKEFEYVSKATYYTIELEEDKDSSMNGKVPAYKEGSTVITSVDATILCEEDPTGEDVGKYKGQQRYVEIVNDEVKFVYALSRTYEAKSCTKDANGIYTVETTTKGVTYYVVVVGDNIVMDTDLNDLKARAGINN